MTDPSYHDAAVGPYIQPKTACARFYDWCLGTEESLERDEAPAREPVIHLDDYRRARPFAVPVLRPEPAEIIEMPRDRTAVRKDRRHAG